MIRYTFKLVQGESKLNDIIRRMKGNDARVTFCEFTGICGDIRIRSFYARPVPGEGFKQFFLLYMEHRNGITDDVNKAEQACRILIEGENVQVESIQQMKKNAPSMYNEILELSKHIKYE